MNRVAIRNPKTNTVWVFNLTAAELVRITIYDPVNTEVDGSSSTLTYADSMSSYTALIQSGWVLIGDSELIQLLVFRDSYEWGVADNYTLPTMS